MRFFIRLLAVACCAVAAFSSSASAEERALKPGDSFKECAECPEMVVLPAGEFTMGSSDYDEEKPPTR